MYWLFVEGMAGIGTGMDRTSILKFNINEHHNETYMLPKCIILLVAS